MTLGKGTPEAVMPSSRKQLNIRLDTETELRVARLLPAISAAIGLSVSQSDLFRLGLIELEKKYLSQETDPETPKDKGKRK